MRMYSLLLTLMLLALLPGFSAAEGAPVVISEVMASNGTFTNGESYDWVELHNVSGKTVDLGGWGLSDSLKKPGKFVFPAGTKLKKDAYLLVYCTGTEHKSGSGSVFYAPFKLSAKGDDVLLTDAEGGEVCALTFPAQFGNISWGLPAGGSEYGYFENDTPGKANEKTVYQARSGAPALDTPGGFYSAGQVVLAHAEDGDTLRYTTDGSTPTAKSKAFPAAGLTVKKTTILRVRAFRDGLLPSVTVSGTYFVGEDDLTVPVVSLVTDDKYFFSKKIGLLVKGSGSYPNYERDWEYPVNIEYFDAEGKCLISQVGTFSISGHSARINAQKSIAVYARKAWGPEFFDFNPFPHRTYTRYKALLLRSTNSDAYAERLRDVVYTSMSEGLDLCYQDGLPIVVFINGEYWGHYNLREKINKYMVAAWEGISLSDEDTVDAIDILARTGEDRWVQNGDNADWEALCDFCRNSDLNDPENLRYVTDRLDVQNLFTHAAFEIITGNSDVTNVRVYRVPGGKWKYLLFDVEAGFGSHSDTETMPLEKYIRPVSDKPAAFRHEPLNALLKVPEMKAAFLTRFAEVLEHSFRWPYVESKFKVMEDALEVLLPRHIKRWKNITLKNWRTNVNATKYYARVRPKLIVGMLQKRMKLTDEEVETYFGEVQRLLEVTNAKPK
ncbi:MAG: CotH kinase family protein [Clostridia bacterium]|nr:CotH kinase family protein [Clostridia bacterium]